MNVLVKMRTTAAGPKGTHVAGSTVSIDSELAKQYVAGGYAILIETPTEKKEEAEKAIKGPKEKATLFRKLEK